MSSPALDLDPLWLNEPVRWRRSGEELLLTVTAGTDFWRRTRTGTILDSGHLYGVRVPGEFSAQVEVSAAVRAQRDQAGLMVRLDAERWVSCGLTVANGVVSVGTVVTHAVSDWSVCGLPAAPQWLGLRVRRLGDALTVEYALDVTDPDPLWLLHRVAFLPPALPVSVGPMAASPNGSGFDVTFRRLDVRPD
jgi:regulation of enolase protein 1 (concanavalin A-like superfamily)